MVFGSSVSWKMIDSLILWWRNFVHYECRSSFDLTDVLRIIYLRVPVFK